jgi:hypothetical protein
MTYWVTPTNEMFHHHGKKAINYYNQQTLDRRDKYSINKERIYQREIRSFLENGYVIFEQAISHDLIDTILEKTNKIISDGTGLKAHDDHFAVIRDPFLQIEECAEIAFDDRLIQFGTEYYRSMPAVGTFNLRKTYLNNQDPKATQLFHCDRNSLNFFKFFVYLNDVNGPEDGPLTLIKGSNKKRPLIHTAKHRWSEDEMRELYGDDSLVYLTAKKGDLIAATTICYHRGTKPTKQERNMLTINYVTHPELNDGLPNNPVNFDKISKKVFNSLPEHKKPVADFLEKV